MVYTGCAYAALTSFFFQICTDIDECSEDPPKCATESKCINSMVRILENASPACMFFLSVCLSVFVSICVSVS